MTPLRLLDFPLWRRLLPGALLVLMCAAAASAEDPAAARREHIAAAKGYMNAGQWGYANYEWRAALAADPKSLAANVGLAEALVSSGSPLEALKHLEEARRHLDKLYIELSYGQTLTLLGRYQDAERVYLRTLEKVGVEPESFRRLMALAPQLPAAQQKPLQAYLVATARKATQAGQAALRREAYREAADQLAMSVAYAADPRDLNDYGVALLLLGRYEEARKQFRAAQKQSNPYWESYANAALAALALGNNVEAAQAVETALSLCKAPSAKALLYNELGFIYENGSRYQKARNAYERALQLDPALYKARLNLAYVYQKDRAYKEAIAAYRALAAAQPGNAAVWNGLGFVYELAYQDRQAVSAYKKATTAQPEAEEGYYNLAQLYRKLGRLREADQAYHQLMAIEFRRMEQGQQANAAGKQATPAKKAVQARLLDYVDVFFSGGQPS